MASKLITRSLLRFRPAAAISASKSAYQSYARPPFTHYVSNWIFSRPRVDLRSYKAFNGVNLRNFSSTPGMEPIGLSASLSHVRGKEFKLNSPGINKMENDESLSVFLNMSGMKKVEDVKLRVTYDDLLIIESETHERTYLWRMKLPENVDRTMISRIKGEMMNDGMFKLTIPKTNVLIKPKEFNNNTNIFTNTIRVFKNTLISLIGASMLSVTMPIARSYIVVKTFCPRTYDAFSIYKKWSPKSLEDLSIMRKVDKLELIGEDQISVSLNMPEFKIEDVNLYLKYGALFIEGKAKTKTNNVHSLTAIRLPKSLLKNRSMIKAEMQEGVYKATLSRVTGEFKITN